MIELRPDLKTWVSKPPETVEPKLWENLVSGHTSIYPIQGTNTCFKAVLESRLEPYQNPLQLSTNIFMMEFSKLCSIA